MNRREAENLGVLCVLCCLCALRVFHIRGGSNGPNPEGAEEAENTEKLFWISLRLGASAVKFDSFCIKFRASRSLAHYPSASQRNRTTASAPNTTANSSITAMGARAAVSPK